MDQHTAECCTTSQLVHNDEPVEQDMSSEIAGTDGSSAAACVPNYITIPREIAILPLAANVIFPSALYPLTLQGTDAVRLFAELQSSKTPFGLFLQHDAAQEDPEPNDLNRIGTAALIYSSQQDSADEIKVMVQGLMRVRLTEVTRRTPYFIGRVELLPDRVGNSTPSQLAEIEGKVRSEYVSLLAEHPDIGAGLAEAADSLDDLTLLAYMVAATAPLENEQRQEILEADGAAAKLELVLLALRQLRGQREVGSAIQHQVQEHISRVEREFLLREQLKAIQRQLGAGAESSDIDLLRERLGEADMPDDARADAERELSRLAAMTPASPEYAGVRNYLDWLLDLPWNRSSGGVIDIAWARQILNRDHFGLPDVKTRILEYLAVRKLRQVRSLQGNGSASAAPDRQPILLLVGPPGVGKTSLAQSIAEALDRPFVRIPVGGMRDEAEIRGHRRTYLGAMPGRIIQGLRRVGVNDPVVLLDEIDKISGESRGDPESALLEVLDPTQNGEFRDHYLDVPFDLSHVLFIATANVCDTIHPALRDRLEAIELSGYIEEEKLQIARQHLIPRQLAAHALTGADVVWNDEAVLSLIRDHTREAGVRNLEREIAAIARRVAGAVVEDEGASAPMLIDPAAVVAQLGKPRYSAEVAEATERPGVATGLVWTPVGGDIVFIEASRMPGGKTLTVTGQLGEIMRESAQAALTWVRSNSAEIGVDPRFFDTQDIHIHVPAGAVPKDGPSAGVTLTAALVSLLTDTPLRSDVAMTGEITLRGRVLPVGGIKEKVLAAKRAGLRRIILPCRNERDLDELALEVRDALEFVLVDTMPEVLEAALERPPVAKPRRAARGGYSRRSPRLDPAAPLAASGQRTE